MKLFHYGKVPNPNFGDALNEWLWERLLPGCFGEDDGTYFSGIGTIISSRMPAARRWVVFTSGAGYDAPPRDFGGAGWDVVAVRGPLTAKVLGLPEELAVADGALLLATLAEFAPLPESDRKGVVFVPHHSVDDRVAWHDICARAGVEYVSPRQDGQSVIGRLRSARLVLADAMHAAIVADALRVPWLPLVSSPRISTFKWFDWTRSMNLVYAPVRLPAASATTALSDSLLWLSGDDHHVATSDEPETIMRFERQRRLRQSRWWPRTRRLSRIVQRNAARVARPVARIGLDGARRERVVRTLAEAASRGGMLSAERVFAVRLEVLSERLSTVRRICMMASP